MLQIFYKEKPIIISEKKSDTKDSLLINLELLENIDIIDLLKKKRIKSIGIKSKKKEKIFIKS